MKHGKTLLLLLLLTCGLAFNVYGQGSNTVYAFLAFSCPGTICSVPTSSTAAGGYLGPVRNIGQASHQAYLTIGSIPGHSCTPTVPVTTIQIVGNNSNNTALSQPIPQLANSTLATGAVQLQGTALYPYVWLKVTFTDSSSNCNYSVSYAGSTQGIALVNNNLSQLVQGGTGATPVGPGTTPFLSPPGGTSSAYSPILFGYSLSTSTAAANAIIECWNGTTVTGTPIEYTLAVGVPVVVPLTSLPLLVCAAGNTMQLVTSGAGSLVSFNGQGTIFPATQPWLY